MDGISKELLDKATLASHAARSLATLSTAGKNAALRAMASAITANMDLILDENAKDVAIATENGADEHILDRLRLTSDRVDGIVDGIAQVIQLPDPIGEVIESRIVESGLEVSRRRVPLGVVGIIYEARPNVTVDVAALCLKSGNALVLRGGSEALNSNRALVAVMSEAAREGGAPDGWVQSLENMDRAIVGQMLRLNSLIDVIVPRGGAELVSFVTHNSTVPVLETGFGVCHTYVHERADHDKAVRVVFNAKVRRPSICNALDSLLVDRKIAAEFLPCIARDLDQAGVEMRVDPDAAAAIAEVAPTTAAAPEDYDTEFLSKRVAVSVVDGLDEAIRHIRAHGSGHSEAIVTEDHSVARRFVNEVDAGAVYVNASTQFTDGGEFGLGAEIGISTQKLHARGPMGLREMTAYKWVVIGDGHTRP